MPILDCEKCDQHPTQHVSVAVRISSVGWFAGEHMDIAFVADNPAYYGGYFYIVLPTIATAIPIERSIDSG